MGIFSNIVGGIAERKAADARAKAARAAGHVAREQAYRGARAMRKQSRHAAAMMNVMQSASGVEGGTSGDIISENVGEMEIEAWAMEEYGRNAMKFADMEAAGHEKAGQLATVGSALATAGSALRLGVGGGFSAVADFGKALKNNTPFKLGMD